MFSNTEVIVSQIVITQYIVASLSLSVSVNDQFTEAYQFIKIMIKFQKQKLFKYIIRKEISAFSLPPTQYRPSF